MIKSNNLIILILIFFSLISFSYSEVNLKILMKIDNQIITNYDLEKEANYLLALNPSLKEIDKRKLMTISKRSLVKEKIRKNEKTDLSKIMLINCICCLLSSCN